MIIIQSIWKQLSEGAVIHQLYTETSSLQAGIVNTILITLPTRAFHVVYYRIMFYF